MPLYTVKLATGDSFDVEAEGYRKSEDGATIELVDNGLAVGEFASNMVVAIAVRTDPPAAEQVQPAAQPEQPQQ